jgi:hypothetical protein
VTRIVAAVLLAVCAALYLTHRLHAARTVIAAAIADDAWAPHCEHCAQADSDHANSIQPFDFQLWDQECTR